MEEDLNQNVVPPTEPVAVTPTLLTNQPPFGSWWKVGVLVVGVLLAGSIAYAGYQYSQKQTPSVAQPTPTPVVVATPTPDLTANWKTYTDTKYGYSIKYPQGWYTYDGVVADYDLRSGENKTLSRSREHLTIQTVVWDNPSKLSTEVYISQLDSGPDAPRVVATEKVTVGGVVGIKRIENRYSITDPTTSIQPTVVVYFAHGDKTFILSAYPEDSVLINSFDQILSTFKFIG